MHGQKKTSKDILSYIEILSVFHSSFDSAVFHLRFNILYRI